MPDISSVLEANLTPAQLAAATDTAQEVLTLACAGSGKSRTLAFRVARLIASGEDPVGLVAFTFTDKAADFIKLRVADALTQAGLPATIIGAMYIGTIHAYCQYVLEKIDARFRQFEVLDENRLKLYLMSRYPRLRIQPLRAARNARYFETVRQVSDAWKTMNDELIRLEDVINHDQVLGRALEAVTEGLGNDQFIDFSLMIRLVADALASGNPDARRAVAGLKHLMVDEYQDVNPAQETLIRELHKLSSTLFVVGDDDQAIYSWRGADVNNILTFRRRYASCAEHTLSHNFRSTPAIVTVADQFAAAELGATRIMKNPEALTPPGPRDFRNLWFANRQQEAEWVANRIQLLLGKAYQEQGGTIRGLTPGDFAVLMRSTRSAEQNGSPRHAGFTEALLTRQIHYTLEAGGGVFDRPQVIALRNTFELLRNGSPNREVAEQHFQSNILPAFPQAQFDEFARVLAEWGRLIHGPIEGPRRRVYPQRLVHELLHAFGIERSDFDAGTMQDLGVFSKIIQDVETVYLSIDSPQRFQDILNFLGNVAETGYDTATEDILRRPDTVTVSTVHKAKGLEFPVVFIVDVEAGRFPNPIHQYEGWLPAAVMQPAIRRGAYQNTHAEEARLFYTALTRAERFLYVSGCRSLPGGVRQRQPSSFSQRLVNPEISTSQGGMPPGLAEHSPVRRLDETVVPTSYSDIRYYLRCPRDYQYRKSFGFSPPITELFGYGMTVHAAVGKLHEVFANGAPTPAQAEELARRVFHVKHVAPSRDPQNRPGAYERARDSAGSIVKTYAENYADDFQRKRQVEVRFEVPVSHAVIAGAIDLLLQVDEEGNILDARVIDFKAIEGGQDPEGNEKLYWTEFSLQVQLYARAAREVLGENARTGAVHLLKSNKRVDVPVTDEAVDAAVTNVEWAVARMLAGDFPMRPHPEKCGSCDFRALCPQALQEFQTTSLPPPIHRPGTPSTQMARVFSEVQETLSEVPAH